MSTAPPYPEFVTHPVAECRRPDSLRDVPFSTLFTDHMFVAEYSEGAWQSAELPPYGPLPLVPNITALQYGIAVFEGLKAQRSQDGRVTLFRVGDNAHRLNRSAERLAMPSVPEAMFTSAVAELVAIDRDWVPGFGEGELYIRPCLFSIDPSIRVKPAEQFLFTIVAFPFASYYSAPVDAFVSERYVRAFPGGTGAVKPAGNYAPAIRADQDALAAGCQTTLWLDPIEHRYVEECGVMNLFVVVDDGGAPLVLTPPLGGTILPGLTRDSVITLLKSLDIRVEEQAIALDELLELSSAGTLREVFGTGTAATVSHLGSITHRGEKHILPEADENALGSRMREKLRGIARGIEPDPFGWVSYVD